jgi:hypothetical protein
MFKTVILLCSLGGMAVAAQDRPLALTGVSQSSTSTAPATAARPDDISALRDDIRKMRGLVQQMESNLAFVSDTQSPLKHQFELEIQMWKMMIGQMEHRLDAMEKH